MKKRLKLRALRAQRDRLMDKFHEQGGRGVAILATVYDIDREIRELESS